MSAARRVAGALLVTGGLLAGCAGADQSFQDALAERHISVAASEEDTRLLGRDVCARHDANVPVPQIVEEVRARTELGPQATGYVIGAATAAYCAQHLPRLRPPDAP